MKREGAGRSNGARPRRTTERTRSQASKPPPEGDEAPTAPCVAALRAAVGAWRAGGYEGATETTRRLLAYWFWTDHRLPSGTPFVYHPAQREAIETLVFVWECEGVWTRAALLARYAPQLDGAPFDADPFARFAIKMATGSGKTKVIALAIAWQFLNARREKGERAAAYARTFLLLAPNVIVYERLRTDFDGGRIFERDPVVPRDMRWLWDFDCVLRGDRARAPTEGTLFLTNIQQLYRPALASSSEPDAMSAVLGSRPAAAPVDGFDLRERIVRRQGPLMVLNDEAHHAHAPDREWSGAIRGLHASTPLNVQLDLSATPRFPSGALFPWILSDYPLKQAILDGVVKRPVRAVTDAAEAASNRASIRYEAYLVAGVERWMEYVEQLRPLDKMPLLFVMLANTHDADDVGAWLRRKYPDQLGGDRTLVLHTNAAGEVAKADLDAARTAAREVDQEGSRVRAIVSVLMLREGWDVQNVTVVVGLRAFSARAEILPEQAIGRGLRLMFRGQPAAGYRERVDILGNDKFLEFVGDLERLERLPFDRVDLARERVQITTIAPLAARVAFDVELPVLSPALVRRGSLADAIARLDVKQLDSVGLLVGAVAATLEAPPSRLPIAQEVIGTCARRIAEEVRLPGQFAALAAKVREFFASRFFGESVDLDDPQVARSIASANAHDLTTQAFARALGGLVTASAEARLIAPPRALSSCPPFPWSQLVVEAERTVFNLVACDGEHERAFARSLDEAPGVAAFARLPARFGFAIEYLEGGNIRRHHPGWVVRGDDGRSYLLDIVQAAFDPERAAAIRAARRWCETATALTGSEWKYVGADPDRLRALARVPFAAFADGMAAPAVRTGG